MITPPKNKKVGDAAEEEALLYLHKEGLTLLTRNYRCSRGEIDLIMKDKNDIIFVEVRVRNNFHYGTAVSSVNSRKQKKLILTATHYLCQQNCFNKVNCRFDIIGISYTPIGANLEWIKNAFPVQHF